MLNYVYIKRMKKKVKWKNQRKNETTKYTVRSQSAKVAYSAKAHKQQQQLALHFFGRYASQRYRFCVVFLFSCVWFVYACPLMYNIFMLHASFFLFCFSPSTLHSRFPAFTVCVCVSVFWLSIFFSIYIRWSIR